MSAQQERCSQCWFSLWFTRIIVVPAWLTSDVRQAHGVFSAHECFTTSELVARCHHHRMHRSCLPFRRCLLFTDGGRIYTVAWRHPLLRDLLLLRHVFLSLPAAPTHSQGAHFFSQCPCSFLDALLHRVLLASFEVPRVNRSPNKNGAGNGGNDDGFVVASGSAVPDLDRSARHDPRKELCDETSTALDFTCRPQDSSGNRDRPVRGTDGLQCHRRDFRGATASWDSRSRWWRLALDRWRGSWAP